MDVTFVVPVYNEVGTLLEVLHRLSALPLDKEIVVVDDGSTDGSRDLLRRIDDPAVRVLYHPGNRGKGASIRTGLSQARGRVIAVQDADLELDPREFLRLVPPVLAGNAAVVYGSRFLRPRSDLPLLPLLANRVLTLVTNLLHGASITDMETCYKVFRAEVVRSLDLRCLRFEFEPEVTSKVLRAGYRIREMPIAYRPRSAEAGKKIGWRDAVTAIVWLVRCRFWSPGRRDRFASREFTE
ncbi:MAG: glycosyltransferase family 2 protein [Planctomycetes bacterium]|nr:glycosyltransferase family 2 protein [Planctomycetota bacterium]